MASPKDVKDILDNRREFTIKNSKDEDETYYIAQPGASDIRKADWQYSKIYNQAIVDGLLTQSQMIDYLKEKNILSEAYTERLEKVRINLAAELFKLENLAEGMEDDEKEAVAMEVARLRDELFRLNQQVNGPMGNTCENLAEDSRTEYLTSRVVQKKDGTPLWPTFEDYENEENSSLAVKARFEVMLWMQGLNSDFMESTPEQKALRELAQKRLNAVLKDAEEKALEINAKNQETKELDKNLDSESQELPEKRSNVKKSKIGKTKKEGSKKANKAEEKKVTSKNKKGRPKKKKDTPE